MPEFKKVHRITITPMEFVDSCSPEQIIQLHTILSSPMSKQRIKEYKKQIKKDYEFFEKRCEEMERIRNGHSHLNTALSKVEEDHQLEKVLRQSK